MRAIDSPEFEAGGNDWQVLLYLFGAGESYADRVGVYIKRLARTRTEVDAQAGFEALRPWGSHHGGGASIGCPASRGPSRYPRPIQALHVPLEYTRADPHLR